MDISVASEGFLSGVDESFTTLVSPMSIVPAPNLSGTLRFTAQLVDIVSPDNYGATLGQTNLFGLGNSGMFTGTNSNVQVPEPAPISLLGLGGMLLLIRSRRASPAHAGEDRDHA